jgi:hypothetical protein
MGCSWMEESRGEEEGDLSFITDGRKGASGGTMSRGLT